MITIWILSVITFMAGYAVGFLEKSGLNNSENREALASTIKDALKGAKPSGRIGAIKPLSPHKMSIRGTKLEETEQAMEEALDKALQ